MQVVLQARILAVSKVSHPLSVYLPNNAIGVPNWKIGMLSEVNKHFRNFISRSKNKARVQAQPPGKKSVSFMATS